jgi:hypothetical protein
MKELKEKLYELEKVKNLAIDALSCMDAFGTDDWNIILTRDMAKGLLSSMENQPPKSAGVKSIEDYVNGVNPYALIVEEKLDGDYIQQEVVVSLMIKYATIALTAQAKDFELALDEIRRAVVAADPSLFDTCLSSIRATIDKFRNQKPRG